MQTRNDGNARYPACGRGDRRTAEPRSIACDADPSDRWKSAPRRFPCCNKQRCYPWQSAGDCTAHRNSTQEYGIAVQGIE